MPRGKRAQAPGPNPSTSLQTVPGLTRDTTQVGQAAIATSGLRRSTRIQAGAAKAGLHLRGEEQPTFQQVSASRKGRKKEPKTLQSKDATPPARPTATSTQKADARSKKDHSKSSAASRKTKRPPPKRARHSPQTVLSNSRSEEPEGAKGAAKSRRSAGNKRTYLSLVADDEPSPLSESSQARAPPYLPDSLPEEVPQPATASRALSEQALRELTQGLESIEEARRRNRRLDIPNGSFENASSEQGSAQTDPDPFDTFAHKWGYLPPLDDEASRILAAVIKNPSLAKDMARISASQSRQFMTGLVARNVKLESAEGIDRRAEQIRSLKGDEWHEQKGEKESFDLLWKMDREKCDATSSEALFQRTLMINLISRHLLIYPRTAEVIQTFEFSVEETWNCLPMPTRAVVGVETPVTPEQQFLCRPKPDLTLCFNRRAIISDEIWWGLPPATQALACAQDMYKSPNLVFPFLSVEAKSAAIRLDDQKALMQGLNNASQALFNMYEFFRDAFGDEDNAFYDKVRFFSIVAVRDGMLVRVHRAIKFPPDKSPVYLVMQKEPSYRLSFEYREYARIRNIDNFNRSEVLNILKPIMHYAKTQLGKALESAGDRLFKKFSAKPEGFAVRQDFSFYRYGQPAPETGASSKQPSAAPSTNGGQRSANGAWQRSHLSSTQLPPRDAIDDGTREARASKPPEVPSFPMSAGPSQKRTQSAMDIDEDSNHADTQESAGSKRHQASFHSDRMSQGSQSFGISA